MSATLVHPLAHGYHASLDFPVLRGISRMKRQPDREATASEFIAEQPAAIECVEGWVRSVVVSMRRFDDSEAAAQDILLELLCLARAGRIQQTSSFRSYVMTVARHTCIDLFRRRRLRDRIEQPIENPDAASSPDPSPEQQVADAQRWRTARFIYQSLGGDCRKLMGMVFGEGLRAREAGERLGISEGNARVRLHRCLEKARGLRADLWSEN